MHGAMYANAADAPYSGPPPVTFIRLVRFRNIAGIADENRVLFCVANRSCANHSLKSPLLVRFDHIACVIVKANHKILLFYFIEARSLCPEKP